MCFRLVSLSEKSLWVKPISSTHYEKTGHCLLRASYTILAEQCSAQRLLDILKEESSWTILLNNHIADLCPYFQKHAQTFSLHPEIYPPVLTTPLRFREQVVRRSHETNEKEMPIWKEKPLRGQVIKLVFRNRMGFTGYSRNYQKNMAKEHFLKRDMSMSIWMAPTEINPCNIH